jgi:hypothetical protein
VLVFDLAIMLEIVWLGGGTDTTLSRFNGSTNSITIAGSMILSHSDCPGQLYENSMLVKSNFLAVRSKTGVDL